MLALTRHPGESIILYCANEDKVTITYEDSKRGKDRIRLFIDAPQSVRILRGELDKEIEDGN